MRNVTVPVQPNPWAELEAKCHRKVGDFVTEAGFIAAQRRLAANRQPTDAEVLGAQITALTYLAGAAMAENAKLRARLDRGWWARLAAWWRR